MIPAYLIILALYILLAVRFPRVALVTAIPLTLGLYFLATILDNRVAQTLSLTLFPTTLITWIVAQWRAKTWRWIWAKWFLAIFIIMVLLSLTLSIGMAIFFGIAFLVILIILTIAYSVTAYKNLPLEIISTISAGMKQNLPLANALDSTRRAPINRRTRILAQISSWLSQGYPLSAALRQSFPRCPGQITAMIAMGERIDQVAPAVICIEADLLRKAQDRSRIQPIHPLYPLVVLAFVLVVMMGVMTFVTPKMDAVFRDFEITLPRSTAILITIQRALAPWIVSLLPLIFLIIAPLGVYLKFRPRHPQSPHLLSNMADALKWHLPVLRWFETNYSLVHTVESLRLSLSAGATIDGAIENACDLDTNIFFRRRLRRWLARVQRGEEVALSARQCHMGAALAWAFDQKVNPGNTLEVLEVLENFYRTNYGYRLNLARFILWPGVILATGAGVGFVVFAIFSPLVAIIEGMLAYL